jgi:hypothetical protein
MKLVSFKNECLKIFIRTCLQVLKNLKQGGKFYFILKYMFPKSILCDFTHLQGFYVDLLLMHMLYLHN